MVRRAKPFTSIRSLGMSPTSLDISERRLMVHYFASSPRYLSLNPASRIYSARPDATFPLLSRTTP